MSTVEEETETVGSSHLDLCLHPQLLWSSFLRGCGAQTQDVAESLSCQVCSLGNGGLDPVNPEERLPSVHKSRAELRRGFHPVAEIRGPVAALLTRCLDLSVIYHR